MTDERVMKTERCLWCGRAGSGLKQIKRPAHLPQGPLKFQCEDVDACCANVRKQIGYRR